MHRRGGGGIHTHTHTKVWINPISLKTNTETLITGKIAHFLFFSFSFPLRRKGKEKTAAKFPSRKCVLS